MKLVVMEGGLGNQMFRYALILNLRNKGYKASVFLPLFRNTKSFGHQGYELHKLFHVKNYDSFTSLCYTLAVEVFRFFLQFIPNKHWEFLFRLVGVHEIREPDYFQYTTCVFENSHQNELIIGTFQSEKYFENIKKDVLAAFVFNTTDLSEETIRMTELMTTSESVFIHIRRGDYLSPKYFDDFAEICNMDYYNNAIGYISEKLINPYF